MTLQRSVLFVPGDRPERFDKARSSGAHLVVLDIEDGVSPARKADARAAIAAWLDAGGVAALRVNATDTDEHRADCALLTHPGVSAVLLPKAEDPVAVAAFAARVPQGVPIVAIVESARGIWNALDIATVPGVSRLAFGSVDFQLDTGIEAEGEALLYARSRLVLASAAAGIAAPIDGVTVALDDNNRLTADVSTARGLGFGGKLCVHPRQVAAINAGFAPSPGDIAWARTVVAAADAAPATGAIRLDGKLIDRPVVERARRTLESVAP